MATQKTYTVTLTLPTGQRKYYRGHTRKEAEAKRDKDKYLVSQGIRIGDPTTFGELAQTWLELGNATRRTVSAETVKGTLERYVLPSLGHIPVQDIRPVHIRALMCKIAPYSCSTQSKVLQCVKGVFALAVENDIIGKSAVIPSIKPGGAPPEEVQPLTDEQCKALFEATKGTRVWLFLMVLRYAGLRKGEALGLMWSDIDFEANTLTVNRSIVYTAKNRNGVINTNCKTDNAHRTIPMVAELRNALWEEKESLKLSKSRKKSLYVFRTQAGTYLSESSFKRMWDLIKYRSIYSPSSRPLLDHPLDFTVHPHQLRHTCATAWVASGMDPKAVMYLMGHADLDVTMKIYAHFMEEQRREETRSKMELSVAAL